MSDRRHVLHRCSCGKSYDAAEWSALECPGVWPIDTGYLLELRQCRCGSTMAMVMQPVPVEVFEELRKDAAE